MKPRLWDILGTPSIDSFPYVWAKSHHSSFFESWTSFMMAWTPQDSVPLPSRSMSLSFFFSQLFIFTNPIMCVLAMCGPQD